MRSRMRSLSAGLAIRRGGGSGGASPARAVRLLAMDAVVADAGAFDAGAWHALAGLLDGAARYAATAALDAGEDAVLIRARAVGDAKRGGRTLAGDPPIPGEDAADPPV